MLTGTNPAGRKVPPPVALRGRVDGAPVACVTRRSASDRAGEDQLTSLSWLSVWSSSCGGRPCSTRGLMRVSSLAGGEPSDEEEGLQLCNLVIGARDVRFAG